MKKNCKKIKMYKFHFAHENPKILRKVRKCLRGRKTVKP